MRRHFFDQLAKAAGVGIVQRGIYFVQQAKWRGVQAEQGEHKTHGGERFFAAAQQVDGAVFLASGARHDADACGKRVAVGELQGGFAAAKQRGEDALHFGVDGVEGFQEAGFGFVVDLGDGFFQQGDGVLHVFALAAVIGFALLGFGKLVQRGKIDCAECFNLRQQAVDMLRQRFQAA